MYNVYPYSAAHAIAEQSKIADRADSFTRIKTDISGKEHTAVQSSLHTLEAHVRAVNTTRLQHALHAEQIRLANDDRSGPIGRAITTIRISVGGALITLGEKLHNERRGTPNVANAPRTKVA